MMRATIQRWVRVLNNVSPRSTLPLPRPLVRLSARSYSTQDPIKEVGEKIGKLTTNVFTGGVGALIEAGASASDVYGNFQAEYEHLCANIEDSLKARFAPKPPVFGPVFPHKMWKKEFDRVRSSVVVVYGPSGKGKSVAVADMFSGREAVVHIPLRGLSEPQGVQRAVANAIGIQDRLSNVSVNQIDVPTMIHLLQTQLQRRKSKDTPVVLVEDIHSLLAQENLKPKAVEIMSRLLELSLSVDVQIVYTVSDESAVREMQAVTGHTYRLRPVWFSGISDEELKSYLTLLAVKVTDTKIREELHSLSWAEKFKELAKTVQSWTFMGPDDKDVIQILPDNSEVNLIVEKLGDHMAHTMECVREYFIHGIPVQVVLDSTISVSLGKLERLFEDLNVNSALAAFCLLEALQEADTIKWTSLFTGQATCSFAEVSPLVRRLITDNILTSPQAGFVALHARILRWAFKKLKEDKNFWRYKFDGVEVKAVPALHELLAS